MRQKGFTLIELLVGMAVGGVILTGVVLSIHQVVVGTDRSNSEVVALNDVHSAALRIKRDIMMSHNTDLTEGIPQENSIQLGWTDYTLFEPTENHTHSSSYTLSGNELLRNYDGTVSIAGRNIESVFFTQDGRIVNTIITAVGPGASKRSETLEFSVYLRTVGIEEE